MGSTRTKTGSRRTRTKKTMHIPKDVMFEIFLKLPVEYLLRLRWLCKYWFKVITDPYFVKMHLKHVNDDATTNPPLVLIKGVRYRPGHAQEFHSLNTMNHEKVNIKAPLQFTSSKNTQMVGSCNGLLCIVCYYFCVPSIFIWNPSTKQYKMIWRSTIETYGSYGFGYDCSTDDYKVIRIVDNVTETLIDVHTLGTSSSKTLRRNNRFYFGGTNGVSVNGNLYWNAGLIMSSELDIIVAFDVAKEEYKQITSKPYINDVQSRSMHLGQLKGCLCVVKVSNCGKSMEVWVMNHNADDIKKEYSWDILYTISPGSQIDDWAYIKPLKFCRNGEFVMVMNMSLILYDPKTKQIRLRPIIRGMKSIETYIESLVPVKGGSYIDGSPSTATIDGPPSIATGKRKREVKRPLEFQDEY